MLLLALMLSLYIYKTFFFTNFFQEFCVGLLRGVDWNILLGKGDCGGHSAFVSSSPTKLGFWRSRRRNLKQNLVSVAAKPQRGSLLLIICWVAKVSCGWCLLLHCMGSHPLITSSELPSHACNLSVEWDHAVTITQKSYAGCSFTVSKILFIFRFPQLLVLFDFRVKNWETSWFTVVLVKKKHKNKTPLHSFFLPN